MNDLMDILLRADSERADQTACDSKAVDALVGSFLLPLAERIVEKGGPQHNYASGIIGKKKPQHIAELHIETPELAELQPGLRIALEKRSKGGNENPDHYHYWVGATVVQRANSNYGAYPAHIRWGLWTHAPKVKERIRGPYRQLCSKLEWSPKACIVSRPVLNLKSFWLTLVGGLVEVAELTDRDALASLQERIAAELVALSKALRR